MVDHLPLRTGGSIQRPRPHHHSLVLLVGRMTTIKLAYWAALTVVELVLPAADSAAIDQRLPISFAAAAVLSIGAVLWARVSARVTDRRSGRLERSLATVATTFVAASVVASPASLPLLVIERQRSVEGCPALVACHLEAIVLWVVTLVIGMAVIPAVFAFSLARDRGGTSARSQASAPGGGGAP